MLEEEHRQVNTCAYEALRMLKAHIHRCDLGMLKSFPQIDSPELEPSTSDTGDGLNSVRCSNVFESVNLNDNQPVRRKPNRTLASFNEIEDEEDVSSDRMDAAPLLLRPLTVPPLQVLLLAVGTRGDVAPFVQLGRRLQQQYGHCVRLATHECFRTYVTRQGLGFHPLAGDPLKLSEFMVWLTSFFL